MHAMPAIRLDAHLTYQYQKCPSFEEDVLVQTSRILICHGTVINNYIIYI